MSYVQVFHFLPCKMGHPSTARANEHDWLHKFIGTSKNQKQSKTNENKNKTKKYQERLVQRKNIRIVIL